MSLLARLFDFTPGTVIQSSQVDNEFNQLINLLAGISTDKAVVIKHSTVGEVAIKINKTDATQNIQEWQVNGTMESRIKGDGTAEFGTTVTILSNAGQGCTLAIQDADGETLQLINDANNTDFQQGNATLFTLRGGANDDTQFKRPVSKLINSIETELGGQYSNNVTTIGNVGAGEDDLHSFTLPANFFAAVGDSLDIVTGGDFAANANNKRIRAYLDGQVYFDGGAVATNGGGWALKVTIVRIDSDSVRTVWIHTTNSSVNLGYGRHFQLDGLTFSSSMVLKFTGEATANNDVTQTITLLKKFDVV